LGAIFFFFFFFCFLAFPLDLFVLSNPVTIHACFLACPGCPSELSINRLNRIVNYNH
jgi:hypothetical protein